MARREEVAPQLLSILEQMSDRSGGIDAEGGYMAHLYAMFLLAQFRETRAYPRWSDLHYFRATSWILSAVTSSPKTSVGCWRQFAAVSWGASNP